MFLNILLYGDPGVGKTRLAGSALDVAELAPVLFIDIEGGTYTLKDSFPDVDVVRVKSWKQMQNVYDELYRGQHGYRTIVLDSLTEIQKFSMLGIMQSLIAEKPDRDPDIPSVQEWGKNIEQTRKLVRAFRDLPMHSIFTALSKEDKDPRTGMRKMKPSLSGKLSDEVAGFFDIVLYMYMKLVDDEPKRYLLTGATESHVAKDRSNKLPTVVEQANMQNIFNLIYEKETN